MATSNAIPRTALKPAPYNPRRISPEALSGLQSSVERFGDISGIVWNCTTGHIVAGHQRITALETRGAVYQDNPPAFLLGDRTFPVRIVEWDETTEKAANVTANNAEIAGEFTEDMQEVLDDLAGFEGFNDLRLGDLVSHDELLFRPDGDKAGASPWDRVGDAMDGVLFSFGEITARVSQEVYDLFMSGSPDENIAQWVEARIREVCDS